MAKRIDTHAHCRDGEQAYKATIGEVMGLARNIGIVAVCDMPNKKPAVTREEQVNHYVSLAERQGFREGYYLWIGGTKDPGQIKEAVTAATFHPRVPGIKTFAADGGELEISEKPDQQNFFVNLRENGYKGVSAWHCEKRSYFRANKWDPERPWTWNDARPEWAEIASAEDIIESAIKADFEGILYILHVTCPETVDLVEGYRQYLKNKKRMVIICGATPHSLLITTEDMKGKMGLKYKANPPIRPPETVYKLRKSLERIDFIESDHAPHSPEEKFANGYLSGYTSYEIYSPLIEALSSLGLTEKRIEDMTYNNAKKFFPKIKE